MRTPQNIRILQQLSTDFGSKIKMPRGARDKGKSEWKMENAIFFLNRCSYTLANKNIYIL